MGIISNFLFKHFKRYRESHVVTHKKVSGSVSGGGAEVIVKSNLDKIPYKKRTKDMCIEAYESVSASSREKVLKDIPSEYFEDYEFCLSLVFGGPEALDYVPEKFKDELMIAASNTNVNYITTHTQQIITINIR